MFLVFDYQTNVVLGAENIDPVIRNAMVPRPHLSPRLDIQLGGIARNLLTINGAQVEQSASGTDYFSPPP